MNTATPEELRFLKTAITRSNRVFYAVGSGVSLFGFFVLWLTIFGDDSAWDGSFWMRWAGGSALTILILGPGLLMLWVAFKADRDADSSLLKTLQHHPENIVWIYENRVQHSNAGALSTRSFLHVRLQNGKALPFYITQKDLQATTDLLRKLCPHADFGYTPELAKKYQTF